MSLKKMAAWTIAGAALPLMADSTLFPYEDRGVVKTWLCGAAEIGAIGLLIWAFDETGIRKSGKLEALTENVSISQK